MVGRSQNGLTGKYANYTRAEDRRFKYELRGIPYSPPNERAFNQDHDIRCVNCNTVFHNEDNDVRAAGGRMVPPERYYGFGRDTFWCDPCFRAFFVLAFRRGPDLVDGQFSLGQEPVASVGGLIFLNEDQSPAPNLSADEVASAVFYNIDHVDWYGLAHKLVALSGVHYPIPHATFHSGIRIRYAGWITHLDNTVVLPGGARVLKKDSRITISGRAAFRRNVLTVSSKTPTSDGESASSYITGAEIEIGIAQSRLHILRGNLMWEKSKVVTAEAAIARVLGTTEVDEDEVIPDPMTPLLLTDALAIIYNHITTRQQDSKLALSQKRALDLVEHQLEYLLPTTSETVLHELVRYWAEAVFQDQSTGTHVLRQRFAQISRHIVALPVIKDSPERSRLVPPSRRSDTLADDIDPAAPHPG